MTFWSTFSLNENVWILIRISLKFVCKGPVNNIPALVQIMARRRRGNKPLSEPMMVRLPMHICVTRPQWLKIIQHWKSKMSLLNVTYICIYIYIVIGTNHHQTQCIGEVNPSRDRNRDSDDPWWSHQMETFSAFVRGIHRSPVNSPHKGQWRGALMFSLICAWINDWVNNGEAGDLRRNHAHYDAIVMQIQVPIIGVTVPADGLLLSRLRGLVTTNYIYIFLKAMKDFEYDFYTPCFNGSWKGVNWFHLVHWSVCPSVDRIVSALSIFAGSLSYLHISSSNFRRCVTCKVTKLTNLKFWQILWICNFDSVIVWLGIQYESIVWVIMGWRGILRMQAF